MSVNKAILVGNLGKDPEIRQLENSKIAKFTLATSEKGYTTKSGKTIPERTEWHNITVFGGLADVAEKFLKKGTRVYIEGKIRYSSYDKQNGEKGYSTDIFCENMEILSPKSDTIAPNGVSSQSQASYPQQPANAPQAKPQAYSSENPFPPQGLGGDDLPF